jgi:hypothetical protein
MWAAAFFPQCIIVLIPNKVVVGGLNEYVEFDPEGYPERVRTKADSF